MKEKTSRKIASWLLLAVFLPMLVFSSLHIHENQLTTGEECTECVNHQPHAGHFSTSMSFYDSCVLCQFISLSYLAVAIVTVVAYQQVRNLRPIICPYHAQRDLKGMVGLRAPPVFLH